MGELDWFLIEVEEHHAEDRLENEQDQW